MFVKWKSKAIKIDNFRPVVYIDYLNNITGFFNGKPPETIYQGELYYFRVPKPNENLWRNVFPKEYQDHWILARCYNIFPSERTIRVGKDYFPQHGEHSTSFSGFFSFYIVDVLDTEQELLKRSKLKGFRHVIDDNRYIDRIPLINELTHKDNGVISYQKIETYYKIAKGDNWRDFELAHSTDNDKTFSILRMLNRGHENPER